MGNAAFGTRPTCLSVKSIDVRHFQRQGLLQPGKTFRYSWTCGDVPSGSIRGLTEREAVILIDVRPESDTKLIVQRVPFTWPAYRVGGPRPMFICTATSNGRTCGRKVTVLYAPAETFACRHCHGLVDASQQGSLLDRNLSLAQEIRRELGGSPSVLDPFPAKPLGMHQRTYLRLRARAENAEAACRKVFGLQTW